MLPLQDVVRTERAPVATLAIIGINLLIAGVEATLKASASVVAPFSAINLPMLVAVTWFLWLFGDNVEARLGRLTFALIYLVGGFAPGIGASGAVTAILGSYIVLLPQSRVLVLVPVPEILVEVPAAFFFALWFVLHAPLFVAQPAALWSFAGAVAVGALVARWRQRPVVW